MNDCSVVGDEHDGADDALFGKRLVNRNVNASRCLRKNQGDLWGVVLYNHNDHS